MESDLPNFDLPSDYMVGEGYGINLLKRSKNFPCRVKAGFFILCVKGIMQTTINGNLQNIGENDLITLPPGYFMEILDFSPDIHIYYAGFSSGFIEGINLMKSTEHLLPIIMENPIIRFKPTAKIMLMPIVTSAFSINPLMTPVNSPMSIKTKPAIIVASQMSLLRIFLNIGSHLLPLTFAE